jgi:hypothetical protein
MKQWWVIKLIVYYHYNSQDGDSDEDQEDSENDNEEEDGSHQVSLKEHEAVMSN